MPTGVRLEEVHGILNARTGQNHWHTLDIDTVVRTLAVNPEAGLADGTVVQRRDEVGPNVLASVKGPSPVRIFLKQFADVLILVLIAAALVSSIVGEATDAAAILVIVLLNAVVGAVQEYRADRAITALRSLVTPTARVRRDGAAAVIPAADLVPGDVVLLEAGDGVPADVRLLEAHQFAVDEAALTGESEPVSKRIDALQDAGLALGDRLNMGFKGSLVTRGRAIGIVVATGQVTELGRIAALLRDTGRGKTPLQKRLARFSRRLALVVLAICALIFAAGLLRGEPAVLMFLTAVSLAVAAVPEALPAVITVALALGARTMSGVRALVRRLPAVETLGSVSYICADKTGTLTENRMRVEYLRTPGWSPQGGPADDTELTALRIAIALNNDVEVLDGRVVSGDPTEVALVEHAALKGFDKQQLASTYRRTGEVPFDSTLKRMITVHEGPEGTVAFVKGAPEAVLPLCAAGPDTGSGPQEVLREAEAMAGDGYRVLAVAKKKLASDDERAEPGYVMLGLVALLDPPREGVAAAVARCRSAGITPVMITGDHPGTALAIAQRVGIADHDAVAVTGAELASMSRQELEARAVDIAVYARVDPEQKIRIVEALQSQGEFVAMTGDGVNDAPALKRADIGIAMGKKGTEVAREAAEMVLLDDNFATIVRAIAEGRRIFDNILKFIKYTLTSNSGEIWTMLLAPLLGLPIPLLPIHILWINLVTDGLPGLALAAERQECDLMSRPPRPPQQSIFAGGMWQHVLVIGLLIGGISIAGQAWSIDRGSTHWQTVVFTLLTFSQLAHVLAIRQERVSVFGRGSGANRLLLAAVALTVLLQLAIIYLPILQPVFKTQPLSLDVLAVCFAAPFAVLIAVEVEKWLARRGAIYQEKARID